MNNYKVYMHIFPNKKKYIGSTGLPLLYRWNNGRGYNGQSKIYDAICKFGWDNVNHYLLFDGLSKQEAELIENALIIKYKTHQNCYGYNSRVHDVPPDFILPTFKKKKVKCKDITVKTTSVSTECQHANCKSVMIIETGEIFPSVSYAASCFMVRNSAISLALKNPNATSCGYHWKYCIEEC